MDQQKWLKRVEPSCHCCCTISFTKSFLFCTPWNVFGCKFLWSCGSERDQLRWLKWINTNGNALCSTTQVRSGYELTCMKHFTCFLFFSVFSHETKLSNVLPTSHDEASSRSKKKIEFWLRLCMCKHTHVWGVLILAQQQSVRFRNTTFILLFYSLEH